MKSLKYLLYTLFAVAAVGCAKDEAFEPGPADSDDVVYFADQPASILKLPNEEKSFEILVERSEIASEIAATYEFDIVSDADKIIKYGSLSFAAGETQSSIAVTFPDAQTGKTYAGAVKISNPDYAAIYKPSIYEFKVTVSYTWELVKGPNGETKGIWSDDILGSYLLGVNVVEKSVEIYKAKEITDYGYYRMINVYDGAYVGLLFDMEEAAVINDGLLSYDIENGETCEINFVVKNDNTVFFPYQPTGFYSPKELLGESSDRGRIKFVSLVPEMFESGGEAKNYGTLSNGRITFPKESIGFEMETYAAGKIYTCNTNGNLYIAFPGAVTPSTIESTTYQGLFTDTQGAQNAVVNFEASENTASIKYALAAGSGSSVDKAGIAAGIIDGSVESAEVTSFSPAYLPVPAAGSYTVVAVPYDADGNAGSFDAKANTASFKVAEAGAEPEELVIKTGVYSILGYFAAQDGAPATSFNFTATDDPNEFIMTDIFGLGDYGYYYKCTLDELTMELSVMPEIPSFEEQLGEPYSFLYGFEYFDEAQTQLMAYVGGGANGVDPWNISLAEVNGEWQLDTFNSFAGIVIFDQATQETLGYMELVQGDNEPVAISYVGPIEASAPAKVSARAKAEMKIRRIANAMNYNFSMPTKKAKSFTLNGAMETLR